MKAALVEGPGLLAVRDVPDPEIGPYDALCELLFGATCTGTDSHIIEGSFGSFPLPAILGHESVGRVIATGSKVRNYRAGDLVTRVCARPSPGISVAWGGFAEFGVATDHWAMCADGLPEARWKQARVNQILPCGVAPETAPMATTWRETLSCLLRLGFKSGSSLLVSGSGGNGLSFARHAILLGASLVAVAGSAKLEAGAKAKAGVQLYFDYRREDLSEAVAKAVPEGFDLIIDAVGKAGTADRLLPCLKPGGSYATYGIDDGSRIAVNPSRAKGPFTVKPCAYDEAETHQLVSEWILQGKLEPSLWYDPSSPRPLSEIGSAFADLKARKAVKALIRLKA